MRAQSSNLNEELGQIEYVFSDKTGTLTCNVMEFKKFSAGKRSYGTGREPKTKQESNVCFDDPQMAKILADGASPDNSSLARVMVFLACCHTIVIDEKLDDDEITLIRKYNAASPDELALVNAAKQFGYEFQGIDEEDNMLIQDHINKRVLQFKLLNVCAFNSTRKRMSVIVRDPSGKIILMCKGADSVIMERLSESSRNGDVLSKTQDYVDEYAEEGLRTLFLAERVISEEEYEKWNAEAQAAKLQVQNREEAVAVVDEIIEVDLELIGSTAIEDRLQDEVPETIMFMKRAGIKVWVLTGDKIETAMNIGVSAGLLDNGMAQYIIEETDEAVLKKRLDAIHYKIHNPALST